MKKIILAPDSFKGTLSSREVCEELAAAIHEILPESEVISLPVADGGEGSVDAFLAAVGGERVQTECAGPNGQRIQAEYGLLPDGTAVVEMAAAAGLPLANPRNPGRTPTFGKDDHVSGRQRHQRRRLRSRRGLRRPILRWKWRFLHTRGRDAEGHRPH